MAKKAQVSGEARITISAPNFQPAIFKIKGVTPYVQNKFSSKARMQIRETQELGLAAKKGKKRDPKDFDACYLEAMHRSTEGWVGIPAPSFRNALISACRIVNFTMTRAKLALFIDADGIDAEDGTPLVRINGEPECLIMPVRNQSGVVDLRARPMWREWSAELRVRFDADQFMIEDVANLLHRAGLQVGIGEGRPDSPKSNGQGWGLFTLANE